MTKKSNTLRMDNMKTSKLREGERTAALVTAVKLVFAAVNGAIGLFSGSVAFHAFADTSQPSLHGSD